MVCCAKKSLNCALLRARDFQNCMMIGYCENCDGLHFWPQSAYGKSRKDWRFCLKLQHMDWYFFVLTRKDSIFDYVIITWFEKNKNLWCLHVILVVKNTFIQCWQIEYFWGALCRYILTLKAGYRFIFIGCSSLLKYIVCKMNWLKVLSCFCSSKILTRLKTFCLCGYRYSL